ncbi:hypothetical protein RIF29_04514 [Crotalaria pallida]|uniref:Leucine-rich repeat-containing N-terminal plant-type domain-containing protein n=1 Tax=Crotalaria pallida TaxID=3830 RepID=A0AAN9P998_CROPI
MSSDHGVVLCNEKDQEKLLIFKEGIIDPYNLLSTWFSKHDCCEWRGVQCDNTTGRITSLHLNNLYLKGSIPSSLGQLEHLQEIDLSHNFFSGSIPSSLGNLSSLEYLDIRSNSLTGNLPESIGVLDNS